MNEDRTCPYCQETAYVLGNLGKVVYYRCSGCGIQFSVQPKAEAKRQAKDRRQAIKAKEKFQNGE